MRAVIQRVSKSIVKVDDDIKGEIKEGILVLLGVGNDDCEDDVSYLVSKIIGLRIFEDKDEKMNLSLMDIKGEMLVISQFTLFGDCRKGKRPSYIKAARPNIAKTLYKSFIEKCKEQGIYVQTGIFQADMKVEIHNNGPVTIMLDSKKAF